MHKILSTQAAPAAIGPYSQGVDAGTFVITSGQLPLGSAILAQAGLTLKDVVKTTVFLKDMNDFAAMNQAYAEFFPENPPARSAVEVARLPKDALVEIEAIAVRTL